MKPLLLIAITILAVGCSGKDELDGVNDNELEERKGIRYLKNSDAPYTGKVFLLYENGQRMGEGTLKDGKPHGLVLQWHKNGQKKMEESSKDGKRVEGSRKFWNNKGEEVSNFSEAYK